MGRAPLPALHGNIVWTRNKCLVFKVGFRDGYCRKSGQSLPTRLKKVLKRKKESEVAQSCLTLWPRGWQPTRLLCPWDSPTRILEWVAISFSRGSSWPRDWTQVSCIAGRRFNLWATREASKKYLLKRRRKEFGVKCTRFMCFEKSFMIVKKAIQIKENICCNACSFPGLA